MWFCLAFLKQLHYLTITCTQNKTGVQSKYFLSWKYGCKISSREKNSGGKIQVHAKFINIHDVDYLSLMHVAKMDRFVIRRPHVAVEELASRTTNQSFFVMFSSDWSSKKNMGTHNFSEGEAELFGGEASSPPPPR